MGVHICANGEDDMEIKLSDSCLYIIALSLISRQNFLFHRHINYVCLQFIGNEEMMRKVGVHLITSQTAHLLECPCT
jgi:hypothetical protein